MLSIGLMSGTSMDGIDAALIETDGSENLIHALGHISIPYRAAFKLLLKACEYACRKNLGDLQKTQLYFREALEAYLQHELHVPAIEIERNIKELSFYMHGKEKGKQAVTFDDVMHHSAFLHVLAIKKLLNETGYQTHQINVVGYHGQTLFHRPSRHISIVVSDGQYVADQSGVTVVSDFRNRDIAMGGQGAPFAPLFHRALAIRDQTIPLAVVNCGGIANISLIPTTDEADLIAFDSGPGNGLIDKLVRQRTQGQYHMDMHGRYGKKGCVNEAVMRALYEKSIIKEGKNYFSMKPPKSLDIGDLTFIPELALLSLEDACATLEAFTADSILTSLDLVNVNLPRQWILVGGGWCNPVIRHEFENRLAQKLGKMVTVQTADEIGWHTQAMEAQVFAYLAVRSLQNKPLSYPGTTGVAHPLSGGCQYVPANE